MLLLTLACSCSAAGSSLCEMCGREVCVCNGGDKPSGADNPGDNDGQEEPVPTGSSLITLKNGVMLTPDGREARLWGVNFQTPISWEYNRLANVGIAKTADAINAVALNNIKDLQMMGVNHLRCHLTPADLTDSEGNLLVNSVYLDALDYMIAEAESRGMYVTFAFLNHMGQYGTGGAWAGRDRSTWIQDPEVVECSRKYVRQLVNHINKYNRKAYKDTGCIAYWELINEPDMFSYDEIFSQSCVSEYRAWLSEKGKADSPDSYAEFRTGTVREYIDGMIDLLREEGDKHLVCWSLNWHRYRKGNKDIFDGVSASKTDLVAFCNYPGQDLVSQSYWENTYNLTDIDFASWFLGQRSSEDGYGWALTDAFSSKGKVVYEFETFFNQSAYLYPLQASYFRSFGVQSASMWTYTFNEIAPYFGGSHFLNINYTPAKAAAFIVAQHIFRNEPHISSFSSTPNEQTTGSYAISRSRNGAVWSSSDTFCHSCEIGDSWNPVPPAPTVKHIAGYGSSPLVSYSGTGIYFIDENDGNLHITLLPDVKIVGDIYSGATYGTEKAILDKVSKNTLTVNLSSWKNAACILYRVDDSGEKKSMGRMNGLSNLKLLPGRYVAEPVK